jgi:hypothetical protein
VAVGAVQRSHHWGWTGVAGWGRVSAAEVPWDDGLDLVLMRSHQMADKAVLRRPKDIDAVINRGGASAPSHDGEREKERIFNLRVPEWMVEQVDAIRKKRTGKISRNTWIV